MDYIRCGGVDYISENDLREALGISENADIFEAIAFLKKSDERAHSEMYKARGEKYELLKQVREILGLNPEVNLFEALRHARGDMDATTRLRLESSELSHRNRELIRRITDIRHAAGMADDDPSDLVEYIKALREKTKENGVLRDNVAEYFEDLAQGRQKELSKLRYEILEVYREIFDCSNGDPEGTDKEVIQDILTEYQRVLKLKDDAESESESDKWRRCIAEILGMNEASYWGNICIRIRMIKHDKDNVLHVLKLLQNDIRGAYTEVFPEDANDKHWFAYDRQAVTDITEALKRERALKETAEEKAIKYKELARENEEKAAKYKDTAKENRVQWNNTNVQLQWAQKENLEWLKRYEKLKSELDEMKRSYGESVITSGGLCEDLTKEREKVRRMEQKLIEIQDICER